MFGQLNSWLGVGEKPREDDVDDENKENEAVGTVKDDNVNDTNEQTPEMDKSEDDSLEKTIDEVSAKAIKSAKEWGSWGFDMVKAYGKTMTETAKSTFKTMEEKTPLVGAFNREQDKFVSDQKEKTKGAEAAVPPWIGYNEEEAMKSQILSLSEDKRNFLRNPPAGVQFQFDFTTMEPVAMATLQEDPSLRKMRFELVPKLIKEDAFWRNYFYRVSLIKQSTQLTSLAQQTGNTGEARTMERSSSSSSVSDSKGRASPQSVPAQTKEDDLPPESPPADNEFVSDAFQDNGISEEDLKKEMHLLGVDEKQQAEEEAENLPQWEKELQQELQEYEMVNESGDLDDADLEKEILQEIEQEAKSM